MQLDIYQIDAFAEKVFEGNPAAVVPLQQWLPDATMQAIAQENNQAETAFFIPEGQGFHIRWFTPTQEAKLCGHATLAAAYVLFKLLGYSGATISFNSLSGMLHVKRKADLLELDFPTQTPEPCATPDLLIQGLGHTPVATLKHSDYLAVFETEADVRALKPDYNCLKQLDGRGVIATAPAENYDFVVRFFAPKCGIDEDSVTGSAYTQLTPYWATVLGKTAFNAKQVSTRGGKLFCQLNGQRVAIAGYAVKYMQGVINLAD